MSENVYETNKLLQEYLLFHYASDSVIMPYDFGPKNYTNFPKRCADLCMEHFQKKMKEGKKWRAFDIGCAVGRSSFELTKTFDEVIGMDYSHSFVDACKLLALNGETDYETTMVGHLTKKHKATISSDLDRTKTSFIQGDACCLPKDVGKFDCVLAANLICRLQTPKDFLHNIGNFIETGGILVITSPYSISEEYTPKKNWFAGYVTSEGKEIHGLDGLLLELSNDFKLIAQENVPFIIKETERKHQWTLAHATVWEKL